MFNFGLFYFHTPVFIIVAFYIFFHVTSLVGEHFYDKRHTETNNTELYLSSFHSQSQRSQNYYQKEKTKKVFPLTRLSYQHYIPLSYSICKRAGAGLTNRPPPENL